MKKYLLWDFDCTLAFRDGKWSSTMQEILNAHHIHVPYDSIHAFMTRGLPWHEFEKSHSELLGNKTWWGHVENYLAKVFINLGVKEHLAVSFSKEFKEVYLDQSKWHLYEDTISTLDELTKQGYHHIIASNHVPELATLVKQLGIDTYFDEIYTSAKMNYDKPNVKFYQEIIQDLDEPQEIVMIGDNYNADVRGAKHAKLKAILVHNENTLHYEYYAQDLKDIPNCLKELEAE